MSYEMLVLQCCQSFYILSECSQYSALFLSLNQHLCPHSFKPTPHLKILGSYQQTPSATPLVRTTSQPLVVPLTIFRTFSALTYPKLTAITCHYLSRKRASITSYRPWDTRESNIFVHRAMRHFIAKTLRIFAQWQRFKSPLRPRILPYNCLFRIPSHP